LRKLFSAPYFLDFPSVRHLFIIKYMKIIQ